MPAMGAESAESRHSCHLLLCTTTKRCASGSIRNLRQVPTASPAVAVEATTAKVVAPRGQHPRSMLQRLPPPTPRAPAPQQPCRQPHASVDATSPIVSSPTRTHHVTRRRRDKQAPLRRAPMEIRTNLTRRTNTAAGIKPACTLAL